MGGGPVQVRSASESAVSALAEAFSASAVTGSREEWAAALGSLQQVIDVATAAQDAAIAQLAAIEPEWLEDGTVVECHRGLGQVALDAPAIVSGVLACSAAHAEGRVRGAVRLAGDGPAGSGTQTGLGGLHAAMRAGRVDAYRASVVAEELEHAPAPVAATVVAALEEHFDVEDGTRLRRRCRRVLARISPDLLRQRAARARAECGLRRWASEPGVDRWEGTFPCEEAAQAWAAIDALARQYLADGVCARIDRARAKALTDLVAGQATITTVLTVTVPAGAAPAPAPSGATDPVASKSTTSSVGAVTGEDDLVEVTGPGAAGDPVLVPRQWLADTVDSASVVQVATCHPETGALLDDTAAGTPRAGTSPSGHSPLGEDRYRPTAAMAKRIRARDRRCRFPGCSIAAVFCDLDHVRPWPNGPTRDDNLICLCRRHHRIKQRPGWTLRLAPNAVLTVTDPTGRDRSTHPIDALTHTVLTNPQRPPREPAAATSSSTARTLVPDGPHTELEFHLEHLGAPPPGTRSLPTATWHDDHGRRHRTDLLPPTMTLVLDHERRHGRRARQPHRGRDDDPPPF
jgi:hypothetical protein